MAKINLLPQEFRVEQHAKIRGLVYKAAAMTLVFVIVSLYSTFFSDYLEQKRRLAEVNRNLGKYYPATANLNILRKSQQDLAQLNGVLQGLQSNRIIWSRVLQLLEDVPEGVSIGGISTGEGNSFIIKGQTSGVPLVGIYFLNIKDNPDFIDLSIQIVKEDLSPEGTPVFTYVLTGHLKGGVK